MMKRFYVSEHAIAEDSATKPWRCKTLKEAVEFALAQTRADGRPRGVVEVRRLVRRECPIVVSRVV